jgi:NADPH:quinone reductase-like Zn-dependent oxidoreductase
MKAIEINSFGNTDVLNLVEIPEPVINSAEVLVNVHATSVNPADSKMRQGLYPTGENFTFPYVLGRDFSGIIEACGNNVTEFEAGDPVFGVLPAGREGTYLEKLAIDANLITRKPNKLTHNEAAAIALTGLTALVAVEDNLDLKAGEKILIHGGAGGVGSYAVQLAHHIGAIVITTASPINHDYLYNLGADQVIDYNTQDFSGTLSDIDVIFDLIGGEVHQRSLKVLKTGGRIAYIAPLLKDAEPPRKDIKIIRPNVNRDRSHLLRIIELFELGAVVAPDIQLFPLDAVGAAHNLIETDHVRGKIILTIN